jgi:phosphatidylinositol alpha-1,6-mannosyltransferase
VLARCGRRPYWILAHGVEAWTLLPYAKRAAFRQADGVIVSNTLNQELVMSRHGIDSERISSLPCTVDETLLGVEPSRNDLQSYLPDGRRVLLTVGRMEASEGYKGHDVVLRAMPSVLAAIPDLTYVIVGEGDDRPRLEGLARDLGVAAHILFTGEVSDSKLAMLYRRCEVFALPTRTVIDEHHPKGEGFGIVFLEAMAFGKPVVGPNYGAPAELIRHGETGLLVDPEDAKAVSAALVNLFTNSEIAREMGSAGSRWVQTHYSYGSFLSRLHSILQNSALGIQDHGKAES